MLACWHFGTKKSKQSDKLCRIVFAAVVSKGCPPAAGRPVGNPAYYSRATAKRLARLPTSSTRIRSPRGRAKRFPSLLESVLEGQQSVSFKHPASCHPHLSLKAKHPHQRNPIIAAAQEKQSAFRL